MRAPGELEADGCSDCGWPTGPRVVAIEVKIGSDMPLPMPLFVISSPIHMTTPVPAVSATTSTPIVNTDWSGMIDEPEQLWISRPERASATIPVDWSTASAIVR